MNNRGQARDRAESCRRLGESGPRRKIRAVGRMVVLAVVIAGIALVAGCGAPTATDVPTVVVVLTTAAPEMPTATRPADTATPTASSTPVPTLTGTATDTPSPVPPTDTPLIPTATSTPMPTDTPLPTDTPPPPTDTPVPPTATAAAPTRTPVPPTATAPPPPQFPWRGQVVNTFSNCSLTRLMGLTLDRNGGIAGDIWVHFWADGWDGAWSRSTWTVNEGYPGLDDSSNWDGVLDQYAKAGTWNVCVVPAEGSWECRSTTVTAQTVAEPCAPDSGGAQIVRIVFQQN